MFDKTVNGSWRKNSFCFFWIEIFNGILQRTEDSLLLFSSNCRWAWSRTRWTFPASPTWTCWRSRSVSSRTTWATCGSAPASLTAASTSEGRSSRPTSPSWQVWICFYIYLKEKKRSWASEQPLIEQLVQLLLIQPCPGDRRRLRGCISCSSSLASIRHGGSCSRRQGVGVRERGADQAATPHILQASQDLVHSSVSRVLWGKKNSVQLRFQLTSTTLLKCSFLWNLSLNK